MAARLSTAQRCAQSGNSDAGDAGYGRYGAPLNLVTTMTYDVAGHVLQSVDPKGNQERVRLQQSGTADRSAMFYAPAPNNAIRAGEHLPTSMATNGRTEKRNGKRARRDDDGIMNRAATG